MQESEEKKDRLREKDRKTDKMSRLLSALSLLETGEFIQPTPLAKMIEVHVNTLKKMIDTIDKEKSGGFSKEVGWRELMGLRIKRNKKGVIKWIIKEEDNDYLKKRIGTIRKELIDMKRDKKQIEELLNKFSDRKG